MSLLTNLITNKIRDSVDSLDGKTLSRPVLNVGDGLNTTYGIDVDVGDGNILRNVPIAQGNNSLLYAEVGSAVRLARSDTGRLEVTGFSKRLPGTYTRLPVTLPDFDFGIPDYTIGTPVDLTNFARPLTYDELATIGGGYGVAPYGAIGIWQGGVLLEII